MLRKVFFCREKGGRSREKERKRGSERERERGREKERERSRERERERAKIKSHDKGLSLLTIRGLFIAAKIQSIPDPFYPKMRCVLCHRRTYFSQRLDISWRTTISQ